MHYLKFYLIIYFEILQFLHNLKQKEAKAADNGKQEYELLDNVLNEFEKSECNKVFRSVDEFNVLQCAVIILGKNCILSKNCTDKIV